MPMLWSPCRIAHLLPKATLRQAPCWAGLEERTINPAPALRLFRTVSYGYSCTHRTQPARWPQPLAGALPNSSTANPSTPASPHPSILVHVSPPLGSHP